MPFNGSGIFTRLYSWVTDRDNGTKILASRMDDELNGMVTGINNLVDGTQPFTAPVKSSYGTAATPSHSFADDPDTGLFRKAANTVGIAVGGAEAYNISSDGIATADGLAAYLAGRATIISAVGSGTYTVPAGAKALLVELCGGGGGGGGASRSGTVARVSTGGQSGAYIKHFIAAPLAASYAYTVGAAGAGGNGVAVADGSAGGDTTFSTLTASGGNAGRNSGSSAATVDVIAGATTGTTPTGNIIARSGVSGTPAYKLSAAVRCSGSGGDSPFGSGGRAVTAPSASTTPFSVNADGRGAGGGGAVCSDTTSFDGGNGTAGIIIVTPLF